MGLRRDLDGLRLQLPGDPAIYLMDAGKKRHIPNPPTYNNLFRDWNGVVPDPDLNSIDTGTEISNGAVLAQAFGDAAVYLIDGGQKRHIGNPATMDRYYLNWNTIQHVAPIIIASIPNRCPDCLAGVKRIEPGAGAPPKPSFGLEWGFSFPITRSS